MSDDSTPVDPRDRRARRLEAKSKNQLENRDARLAAQAEYRAAHRAELREAGRKYREQNPERLRAARHAYREQNAGHIAAYRAAYNAEHREEVLANKREYARRKYREQARIRRRRAYSAKYYANNRDRYIENQKRSIAKRRAENPERFMELQRGRDRRWWARHKDAENAKRRDAYRRDPEAQRQRAEAYYAAHKEEIKAKRRESYAANREKERASQNAARAKARAQRGAGLPARRTRRTPRDERLRNVHEADVFFSHYRGWEQRQAVKRELETEPAVLAAWQRDCLRARAAHHQASLREELEQLRREGRLPSSPQPTREEIAEREELARMDAIARSINDRLRHREAAHPDISTPHPMLRPGGASGLSR